MAAPVSRFGVPDLGVGVGLRVPFYGQVAEQLPAMDWFEIISENFLVDGGSPLYWLERVSARYPLVQHGVSMSLGSREDPDHTARMKSLVRRTQTPWVSDHLCFTHAHVNSHDLLPVPYTREMMDHLVDRCRKAADDFGVPFVVENPSTYLGYKASTMSEWDFLAELAERADVGILLDVNNVFVSSVNHGFDPLAYLDAIPLDRIVQIHLAGHQIRRLEGRGEYRLDTHDSPVCDEVWALYREVIRRAGPISTLVEWDDQLPPWERLVEEAETARRHRDEALASRAT
jgi:uncharacterized protein (UPF0276 family)